MNLLREAALPQAGVLHCFTEDWDMAKAALDMGYYISLSGIVTFRNADALRDLANWLYRQLEQEYDYLTSDGAVDETLVVGSYTFTEEGRRFG